MKFTLVFPSHESRDLAVAGIFIPCFTWQIAETNHVPHPKYPHYRLGDFNYLLKLIHTKLPSDASARSVAVVIHANGHGTSEDLDMLFVDIEQNGFRYKYMNLD